MAFEGEDFPPPPAPTPVVCPESYAKQGTACYRFGTHLSYSGAQLACEAEDANLAGADAINTKFLRAKIAQWGGNDFFIGSYMDRGRVIRKKGTAACPIIKGQNLGGTFGTVDCNSANRYICQYGKTQVKVNTMDTPQFGSAGFAGAPISGGGQPFPFTTLKTTTTDAKAEESSSSNPVIYAVVSIVVIIALLIGLRFLFKRYKSGKKDEKDPFKRDKHEKKKMAEIVESGGGEKLMESKVDSSGNKLVFSATSRQNETKTMKSKSDSIDSAVPPSYASEVNDKPMPLPLISFQAGVGRPLQSDIRPSQFHGNKEEPKFGNSKKVVEREERREGRRRDKEKASRRRSKSAYRRDDDDDSESPKRSRHRISRRNSDPMSEYGYSARNRERKHSTSESSDGSSEGYYQRGPKKVYQRGSKHQRDHYGSRRTGDEREREYGSRRRRHKRRHHRSRGESRHNQDGYYSLGHHRSRRSMQSHSNPSFIHNPPPPKYSEAQYFPQPPKLMSMVESQMKYGENNNHPNENETAPYRMSAMEPIRVNRQIYERYSLGDEAILASAAASKARERKESKKDDEHFYESLDETKSNRKKSPSNDLSGNESEILYGFAL